MRDTTRKTKQKGASAGLHLTSPAAVPEDLFTWVHQQPPVQCRERS